MYVCGVLVVCMCACVCVHVHVCVYVIGASFSSQTTREGICPASHDQEFRILTQRERILVCVWMSDGIKVEAVLFLNIDKIKDFEETENHNQMV